MGSGLYRWKAKEKGSNKLKNMPIGYLVREIWPWEVPGLKVGNSRECPRATPHDPRGEGGQVVQRAVESCVWKVVSLTPAPPL